MAGIDSQYPKLVLREKSPQPTSPCHFGTNALHIQTLLTSETKCMKSQPKVTKDRGRKAPGSSALDISLFYALRLFTNKIRWQSCTCQYGLRPHTANAQLAISYYEDELRRERPEVSRLFCNANRV
eukprot:4415289-Amphidinium_carterae.1